MGIDADWERAISVIGPCTHDPKSAREPYEALIRAVAYQQLTAKAGDAIIGRLCAIGAKTGFPTPSAVITARPDLLRACGFSLTKVATIKAIAEGARSGLVPTGREAKSMADDVLIERLTAIKGIGRWTVEMLLMYTLERGDILPADDLGVREGYRRLKGLPEPPKPKILRDIGAIWAPHRTVASWYLWRIPKG
ncbi:DNA-3-methyladenine glycosylase family protein [Hyphomicrobium sp.]|uniref:DNA-3-methyladenine glycosylase family protein n=1 Tax=Hyphomicrobium sp. TaxID=82 RepID=UPI002FDFCC55